MKAVHVEEKVRCIDCSKVFCKYCEDKCPACFGIHISASRPSLNYARENPAKVK